MSGDAVEHRLDLLRRHPLVLGEEVELGAVEVHRRVGRELEAVVGHLDLTVEGLRARLELALADVAPRTRDVRPHVYFDHFTKYSVLACACFGTDLWQTRVVPFSARIEDQGVQKKPFPTSTISSAPPAQFGLTTTRELLAEGLTHSAIEPSRRPRRAGPSVPGRLLVRPGRALAGGAVGGRGARGGRTARWRTICRRRTCGARRAGQRRYRTCSSRGATTRSTGSSSTTRAVSTHSTSWSTAGFRSRRSRGCSSTSVTC